VQKIPTVGAPGRDLQCAFPLDVPMVSSSSLTIAVDGEHLTCGGFSIGKTIHFGSLEFSTNCFSGLSISPRWNDSDAALMGSSCCGPPSLLWVMIEDSIEEFHTASSREVGSNLPSPRRHSTGALPALVTTTARLENALTTQAIRTVLPLHEPAPEVKGILMMDFTPHPCSG
jgi:hypothetical protein